MLMDNVSNLNICLTELLCVFVILNVNEWGSAEKPLFYN